MKRFDVLAGVYESELWYPVALRLFAGRGQISFAELINLVQEMVGPVSGLVLDAACGPGTMASHRCHPGLLVGEIEKLYTARLEDYARFRGSIGAAKPYRWIAGVTDVKGRRL
jgi:hypothetical protein